MPSTNRPLRYRWTIMAIVWLVYLVGNMGRVSIGPLAPFLKDSLQISNVQIGLLVTANTALYTPTLLLSGWLVDRLGVRLVLFGGAIFGGVTIALIYFFPTYQGMVVILAFAGLGYGCIFPSVAKSLMTWFPDRERATVMGVNQSAVNVAGVIVAVLLPVIALKWFWQTSYLVLGAALVFICLVCVGVYRDLPGYDRRSIKAGSQAKRDGRSLGRTLLKSRDIWILAFAGYFLSVVEFSSITNIVLYLNESLQFGLLAAGGLLAMSQAAGGIGKPLFGIVSDRWFGRRRRPVSLIIALVSGLACLMLGTGTFLHGWLVYLWLVLLGATAMGFAGVIITLAGKMAGPESAGFASGFIGMALSLGGLSGPPVFGYIVDKTGSFPAAWLVMAVCSIVSAILVLAVREKKTGF